MRVAVIRSGLLGLIGLVALAPVALAYQGQLPFTVSLSGPSGTIRCDKTAQILVTVLDPNNNFKPVRKQSVAWSLTKTQSSGDRLSALHTSTNIKGQSSVDLDFGPAAGTRTVKAKVTVVSATVQVKCAGGLPVTTPLAPGSISSATQAEALAPAAPTIDEPGVVATRVRLPRLGMDVPIVEGDGASIPAAAAAHFPGTAWPGSGSNTYLYAHAREGLFLPLWSARTGDLVDVDLVDGTTATYRVTEILPVVPWDALSYLDATNGDRLTLQTCLTYGDVAPRYVVIADRVVADP